MATSPFHLRPADKEHLTTLLRKGTLPNRVFKRATALLDLERGRPRTEIALSLGVTYRTLSSWKKNYRENGLQMLTDQSRSGRPFKIDGDQRAKITALACSTPPEGHSRWSLRLLADKAVELNLIEELSHTHAGRILKKTNSSRT